MSVAPFEIKAKHYGSAFATTDYTSEVHHVYLSSSFVPSERVRFYGTVSFTKSEAALDVVTMPDVTDALNGDLTHQDFTFPEMHEYSDLKYQLIKVDLGVSVRLNPRITWTADAQYGDLTDDAPYVYGNETGSLTMIRTGVKFEL